MFPQWMSLTLLLALTACGTSTLAPQVTTPSGRTDRVVVAPLNVSLRMPTEIEGMEAPVWTALMDHFQSQDRVVRQIHGEDARALWSDVVNEMGDQRNLAGASEAFAQQLAAQSEFDLLVMPSLVMRRAAVRGRTAYWDGVRRRLENGTAQNRIIDEFGPGAASAAVTGLNGQLAGASLYVAVLTSNGEQVYAGLGGLDLLQKVDQTPGPKRDEWQVVLREEPFSSSANLREGVALAMEQQLPRTARAW